MSQSLISRPTGSPVSPVTAPSGSTATGHASAARTGPRGWQPSGRNLADLVVLLPLLAGAGVLHAWGMFGSPARIDDEGTYVSQAWAVLNLGELTHYTYWYDHPPVGWLQIAGYAWVTDAFERAPNAVAAGRELMLLLAVLSAALLWVLARRLDLPRWGAALAVVLFTVSPLAVEYHRYVFLDNIATPWLLASFVLALSPRRRLGAFAAAALCFGVAVLTKETTLLLLPVLAWLVWRRSTGGTRRYAVTVSAAVLVLTGLFYIAFALIKGEVVPTAGRTSLLEGIAFQLGGREPSGSIFSEGTLGNTTVGLWLSLDPVLPVLALVATPLAFLVPRLRVFAVGMLILAAMLVRPGYLPVPFVIAMLPLAALLVAGVAVAMTRFSVPRLTPLVRRLQARGPGRRPVGLLLARPLAPVAVLGLAVAGAAAATSWQAPLTSSLIAPLDEPLTEATDYITSVAQDGERVLTDDAIWVDLVTAGLDREDVVWYYKPDTDPAVPTGVESYAWVVATDSMRNDLGSAPTVTDALTQGVRVATFGEGNQRVDVLRVLPGIDASDPAASTGVGDAGIRAEVGAALAANPTVDGTDDAQALFEDGRVDVRLMTVLVAAADRSRLGVSLPAVPGEEAAGQLRRVLQVDAMGGEPLEVQDARTVAAVFRAQKGALAAAEVAVLDDGGAPVVRVTYDLRPIPGP